MPKEPVADFKFPFQLPTLSIGEKYFRLSPVKTIEEAQVFSIEHISPTVQRGALLSHRYGIVEIASEQVVKSGYEWMPEKQWKLFRVSPQWAVAIGSMGGRWEA